MGKRLLNELFMIAIGLSVVMPSSFTLQAKEQDKPSSFKRDRHGGTKELLPGERQVPLESKEMIKPKKAKKISHQEVRATEHKETKKGVRPELRNPVTDATQAISERLAPHRVEVKRLPDTSKPFPSKKVEEIRKAVQKVKQLEKEQAVKAFEQRKDLRPEYRETGKEFKKSEEGKEFKKTISDMQAKIDELNKKMRDLEKENAELKKPKEKKSDKKLGLIQEVRKARK